jgi:molecular chaperone DnaJ
VEKTKKLSVKVPPGRRYRRPHPSRRRGRSRAEGGPAGDLFVQMSVKQHPIFERDGKHLYCEVPITFVDAALGGELEVPTLDGRVKLKIPPETQTGKLFRLRGKGVQPVRGGGVGDLLCRAVVETPVNLNKRRRSCCASSGEPGAGRSCHSPRQKSWFEGVKSFFDDMKP